MEFPLPPRPADPECGREGPHRGKSSRLYRLHEPLVSATRSITFDYRTQKKASPSSQRAYPVDTEDVETFSEFAALTGRGRDGKNRGQWIEQQIEAVRREAFAAGYAAGMKAIRDIASRPAPDAALSGARAARRRAGRKSAATSAPQTRIQARVVARRRRSAPGRPQPGSNAQMIEAILEAAAPRALRQAQIRKALQEKGKDAAFTSIRHALSQLERGGAAEQVGDSKTWRHRGGAS